MHPNLRGFWRLENTLLDASGNGNNGTVGAGSEAYAAGKMGRAWDSNSTRYADFGNGFANFDRTDPFSVCFWVKSNNTLSSGALSILSRQLNSGTFRGWEVSHYGIGGANLLRFSLANNAPGGVNLIAVNSDIRIDTNEWIHVSISYNGSSNASGVKFYKNGATASETIDSDNLTDTTQTTASLQISGRGGLNRIFTGQLDEVQIYNAALDANDIRRVMMGQMPQRRYA
jgi:hypothetical protein